MDARACLIFFNFFFFLSNATTHLYKRSSPTIRTGGERGGGTCEAGGGGGGGGLRTGRGSYVGWSVGRSVGPVLFSNHGNRVFFIGKTPND